MLGQGIACSNPVGRPSNPSLQRTRLRSPLNSISLGARNRSRQLKMETQRVLDQHEVKVLLDDLCVKLGFCLPPANQATLIAVPPPDAKSFTDSVITLEGLDPTTCDRRVYRKVRALVTAAFQHEEPGHAPRRARAHRSHPR